MKYFLLCLSVITGISVVLLGGAMMRQNEFIRAQDRKITGLSGHIDSLQDAWDDTKMLKSPTLKLAHPTLDTWCSKWRKEVGQADEDCWNYETVVDLQVFIDLLAEQYKYQDSTFESQPPKLVK